MIEFMRRFWEDLKALLLRGERRQSGATRGRVYSRRDSDEGGGNMGAEATRRGTVRARVLRADTGEWEDLGVIADIEE